MVSSEGSAKGRCGSCKGDEGKGRGYSSLVMVDDETVGILYESSRANLVFQKIHLKELDLDQRRRDKRCL